MFTVDTREVKQLEADLKRFKEKAYPFASRNTLNVAAFTARKEWQTNIGREMIERNKFTRNSIRVEKAKSLNVNHQAAAVGSIAPYMEDQEFGETKRKKGKEGVPLVTSYAAGQGMGNRRRTRLPKRANALKNIKLRRAKGRAKGRKQRTLLTVLDAIKSGNRTVFLDLGKTKGIFRVVGGSKKTKRGWPKGAKLRMLYRMTDAAVTIPANPTLGPAVRTVGAKLNEIHAESLKFQLRKYDLFR